MSINQLNAGIEKVAVASAHPYEITKEAESAQKWQDNCMGQCHYAHEADITPSTNVGGERPETPYNDMMAEGYYDIVQGTIGLVGSAVGVTNLTVNTFSVKTPYGRAWQSLDAEAIRLRSQVSDGIEMYRGGRFGETNVADAQFWALESPLSPTYADRYGSGSYFGLPDFVTGGSIKPGENFVTRVAPAVGSNLGGAIEVVTRPNAVHLNYFYVR